MKYAITLVAAAGLASALALPAKAEPAQRSDGLHSKAQAVGHTDISSQRRYYRHGYRYGYGPRYGYRYRPYGYYGGYYGYRPYYQPGVSLGFYGGPRFGVWF